MRWWEVNNGSLADMDGVNCCRKVKKSEGLKKYWLTKEKDSYKL